MLVRESVRTEIRNLTFNDEDAIAQVEQLQRAYPGADIYINGELTVDYPEDVRIPIEPNQMATAALSGSRIKFSYCSLDRAIAMREWAVCSWECRSKNCNLCFKVLITCSC